MDLQALIAALRPHDRGAGRFAAEILATSDGKIDGKPYGKRSLAAKIADLRSGNHRARVWWSKRAELREKLAAVLRVLPAVNSAPEINPVQPFDEFPLLRSLDVRIEEPCDIGFSDWYRLIDGRSRWIEAPHGAGCSLVARRLHVLGRWSHVRASSLSEAVAEVQRRDIAGLVVVDLAGQVPDDHEASRWLRLRRGVLVLAHQPPPGAASMLGCASITVTSTDGGPVLVGPVPRDDQWDHFGWRPADNWRGSLLRWVHRRLSRADVSPKWGHAELEQVLNEVDPAHARIDTPAALLWLLSRATTTKFVDELRAAMLAHDSLESFLVSRYFASGRVNNKTAKQMASALRRLLNEVHARRASNLEHRWTGWIREEDLGEGGEGRARGAKSEARSLEQKARRLVRARLRGTGSEYAVGPRWVSEAFAIGGLATRLRRGAVVDVLALGCAADRCAIVDAAVDQLEQAAFETCLRRVVDGDGDSLFATVASLETLFGACARRFERGEKLPASDIKKLVEKLFSHWRANRPPSDAVATANERANPIPVSRPGLRSSVGDGNAWVANCWSWSLLSEVERPSDFFGEAWLFPGWCSPTLSDFCDPLSAGLTPPHWPTFGAHLGRVDHVWDSSGFHRLEQLAPRALERIHAKMRQSEHLALQIAAPLLPTICASQRWRDRVEAWSSISLGVQTFGVGHRMKAAIDALPDDARAEAASWLLELASRDVDAMASSEAHQGAYRDVVAVLSRLHSHDGSPLLLLVLESITETQLDRVFASRGTQNIERLWDSLEEGDARRRLESAWARCFSSSRVSAEDADTFLLRATLADEIVEPIARHAGHDGAVAIWRRRPALARRLFCSEFRDVRGGFWIARAPEERLPELLEDIESAPSANAPGWLWNWLRWLGQAHPKFAARAHSVLHRNTFASA